MKDEEFFQTEWRIKMEFKRDRRTGNDLPNNILYRDILNPCVSEE